MLPLITAVRTQLKTTRLVVSRNAHSTAQEALAVLLEDFILKQKWKCQANVQALQRGLAGGAACWLPLAGRGPKRGEGGTGCAVPAFYPLLNGR